MKLKEIERLVQELGPSDRLRLAAGICEQLSGEQVDPTMEREARRVRMLAALESCDKVAESIDGEFDSADDLRRIREERITQIGG